MQKVVHIKEDELIISKLLLVRIYQHGYAMAEQLRAGQGLYGSMSCNVPCAFNEVHKKDINHINQKQAQAWQEMLNEIEPLLRAEG